MEAKDSVARKVLGDSFVNHFVSTRKHEWNLWQVAVTDYEMKRYMELVWILKTFFFANKNTVPAHSGSQSITIIPFKVILITIVIFGFPFALKE